MAIKHEVFKQIGGSPSLSDFIFFEIDLSTFECPFSLEITNANRYRIRCYLILYTHRCTEDTLILL